MVSKTPAVVTLALWCPNFHSPSLALALALPFWSQSARPHPEAILHTWVPLFGNFFFKKNDSFAQIVQTNKPSMCEGRPQGS